MENEKGNAWFTVAVVAAILLLLSAADLSGKERLFSETENRLLAQRPRLTQSSVWSGAYMKELESFLTDQFVGRDKWIRIKTLTDLSLGRRELNGVYLGKNGYLLERHLPEEYPQEKLEKQLMRLSRFVGQYDAMVMLVPTADNILSGYLPANAPYFDQRAFLEQVRQTVGAEHYIDVFSALEAHAQEEIYYRTDHHWTSLGAVYGYRAWAEKLGVLRYPYNTNVIETVSDSFEGTLQSKINLPRTPDKITRFRETMLRSIRLTYDRQKRSDSFYEPSYLDTKNQYGYFLDDNHAIIEIETGRVGRGSLIVFKDSYANCFIPLLAPHYTKIYVIDLRYYKGGLNRLMAECTGNEEKEKPDVLILYNCIHFLDNFVYTE